MIFDYRNNDGEVLNMNKKVIFLFFISLLFLILVSTVNAADIRDDNVTILSSGNNYKIVSDLSNEDIQSKFDNAKDGDTFEFTDEKYQDISLIVDKKLNIVSKKNSIVYASDKVSDKAKDLGIDKTFGFYFTSKAKGSVLSGIIIVASNCNYGVVVDNSNDIKISNNKITGGGNGVLIKNSDKITLSGNNITKAKQNGVQLQNVKNTVIKNNIISHNKKSGIETSNIYYCDILNNSIHHNDLNGISTFNKSSNTLISRNNVFENTNGIFINSTSTNDVIKSNSLTHNRKDPRSIIGGFETGNGLLFGFGFRSKGSTILKVEYNYMAHNEFFQAKNYWENENFELGQNWYDSNDPTNTFVCPRLLASLMKLDALSISNTLSFQLSEASGKAVNEFATFQARVNVDGNMYTATFVNGKASIPDLDPNVEHNVQIEIAGQFYKYEVKKASGEQGDSQQSQSSSNEDNSGSENNNADIPQNNGNSDGQQNEANNENSVNNQGRSNNQGNPNNQGNFDNNENSENNQASTTNREKTGEGNSVNSHVSNSDKSGNYGSNSSEIPSQDTTDLGNDALSNGENAVSNGDVSADSSGSDGASQEGKAYEIVPPVTTSKELTNTSGLVVLSILSIMGMLIYGYWRKDEYEE